MGQSPRKSRAQEVPMARCGLAAALHRGRSRGSWRGGGEWGGRTAAVHALGKGVRGYLLLHSAFGPSSMQLREKTEPEGQGWGDRTRVKRRPGEVRGEERKAQSRLGAGPEAQEGHSCPPTEAAATEGTTALTDVSLALGVGRAGWGTRLTPRLSSLGCGTGGSPPQSL